MTESEMHQRRLAYSSALGSILMMLFTITITIGLIMAAIHYPVLAVIGVIVILFSFGWWITG